MALGLSTIEVRVIRPPRELRDAPSSYWSRQADFTFEVGVRNLVFPVTSLHLGRDPTICTHYVVILWWLPQSLCRNLHRPQSSEEMMLDVYEAHEEVVQMTLARP